RRQHVDRRADFPPPAHRRWRARGLRRRPRDRARTGEFHGHGGEHQQCFGRQRAAMNGSGGDLNMRMGTNGRLLLAAALALGIAACGSGEGIAEVNGRKISAQEFESYLALKRIAPESDARRDALLDEYLRREALADVIEDTAVLDAALIEAELNEFRKEMLISRYFEKFLEEQVGEDAVQNYYASNPDQFEETKVRVAHI